MNGYKQIKVNFWQNDFVTGLIPEERYFYMYLITNTMTTQCGIYKFNMKLAELETGYCQETIQKYLKNFEESGKIKISETSKEIMIVNWFKHNFKGSKKYIADINKELREVKDKEFIKQLYELCVEREYPIDAIFRGIILTEPKKDETNLCAEILTEADQVQGVEVKYCSEQKVHNLHDCSAAEDTLRKKETSELTDCDDGTGAVIVSSPFIFEGFERAKKKGRKNKKVKDQVVEEVFLAEEEVIGDQDEIIKGIVEASWSFG